MSQLVAQFTENKIADKDYPCERLSCGKTIHAGELRLHISNEISTQQGKFVCRSCYDYYAGAPTTRRIATAPRGTPQVDIRAIRSNVNESQRRGVHSAPPGHVVGMLPPSAIPTRPRNITAGSAPGNSLLPGYHYDQVSSMPRTVAMPSASQFSFPAASGYSAAHSQYHNQRNLWAGIANRGPSASVALAAVASGEMPIIFVAFYEALIGKGKNKEGFAPIPHVKESTRVSSSILPPEIIALAKKMLLNPLTKALQGFKINLDQTTIRERSTWEDVSLREEDIPYFNGRSEFWHSKSGSSKAAARLEGTFKPPKTGIEFVLVIDRDQWMEYEDYEESGFRAKLDGVPSTSGSYSAASVRSTTSRYSASRADMDSEDNMPPPPTMSLRSAESVSSGRTKRKSPPSPQRITSSKAAKHTSSAPDALNMTLVRNGLVRGGQAVVSMTEANRRIHENIVFYSVQNIPLVTLLQNSDVHPVQLDISMSCVGSISYIPASDSPSFLGKGGFKTAHQADLLLHQTVDNGLGHNVPPNSAFTVALKRPYQFKPNGRAIHRYGLLEEGENVISEANVLGWARSLMEHTYRHIDACISRSGDPPLPLPRLRFVDSAIAFVQKEVTSVKNSAPVSNRAVYLLEEMISGTFRKYVHNKDAVPLAEPGEAGYNTAVFLCFTQHLQYSITFGLVSGVPANLIHERPLTKGTFELYGYLSSKVIASKVIKGRAYQMHTGSLGTTACLS